ncbi:MAG TPA: sigma-70 family RNA polymerase sigma factor [Caulobacteraceae bacterium]
MRMGEGVISKARPVVELSGGEAQAGPLAALYRRHWAELTAYARRTFGAGPPEPEDIVQAAFARFAALPDNTTVANPRAFLFRTAHNIALDARRSQARHGAASLDPQFPGEGHDFSPEDVLVSREELARLEAAIAGLRPRQRTALLLHRLDGLSFAEIGRRMGVSPSGARKLVEQGFAAAMASMRRRR